MSTEKVWLLEDTTIDEIPAPLASLLASTKDSFNSSSQECRLYVLALLNYYIALEIGLRTTPVPQRSVKWGFDIQDIQTQQIPQNFKQQTHFKADLYLPGDRNATRCVLLLMKSGESLFVTLTSEQWPGCSVVLSASRYVPFFNREKPASSFRNLRELSTTLKNIFWPVVNQIIDGNGQKYPGILGIPEQDMVLKWLNKASLTNFALSCQESASIVREFRTRGRR